MESHPQSGLLTPTHAALATLTSLLFLKHPTHAPTSRPLHMEKIHCLLYLEQYYSTRIYLHESLLLLPQVIDQILPSHKAFPDHLILQILFPSLPPFHASLFSIALATCVQYNLYSSNSLSELFPHHHHVALAHQHFQ